MIEECLKIGTKLLKDLSAQLIEQKCKNTSESNLLKNLELLEHKASDVKDALKNVQNIHEKLHNMPIVPEIPIFTIDDSDKNAEEPEIVAKKKKTKSVMLYTTITFAGSIAVR
jgi:hypothetical protein